MQQDHEPDRPSRDRSHAEVSEWSSLASVLRREAPLPLGLRARVEAKVLSAIRRPSAPRVSRLAAGCGLFLLLGAQPNVVLIGPLAVLLFVAVAAYVRFVAVLEDEIGEEPAAPPT